MSLTRREALGMSLAALAMGGNPTAKAQENPASVKTQSSASRRPNILLLLSDDHSTPHLSCYGDANLRTPNLDRLASEGLLCDRFFVSSPQCVPSRAALMTGRSPVAARITRFSSPLPRDVITFPEILRAKAGYRTGVSGRSYHLDGSPNQADVSARVMREHKLKTFDERMDMLHAGSPEENVPRFEAFLDKTPAAQPFFYWANYSDPHHVWNAKDLEPDPKSLRLPAHLPDLPGVREDLAAYYGEVMRLDRDVQKMLDVLQRRGLAQNTIVVFMGDNGHALPHGKGSLYDPGINTPLIVRWPGTIQAKSRSNALTSGEDLAPTLLAAAGIETPREMSGVSQLEVWQGKSKGVRKHVFAERGPHGNVPMGPSVSAAGVDFSRCVRSDRYKLIYNCTPAMPYAPVDSGRGPGWQQMLEAEKVGKLAPEISKAYFSNPRPVMELYDLARDGAELMNLSGQPALAAVEWELKEALQEKMILDFDYLPLPIGGAPRPPATAAATTQKSP